VVCLAVAVLPALAHARASKCQIEWGDEGGSPQSIVQVLARYGDTTKQSFMSRMDLLSMTLKLGVTGTRRCDDSFDDLEGRLAKQHGIYLDAHSGYILLLGSRAEADRLDERWVTQWSAGVVKSESQLSRSCFTGKLSLGKGGPAATIPTTLSEYLARVEKSLKRRVEFPPSVDPARLPLNVLLTKGVCKDGLWNGLVLGLNMNGWRVVPQDQNVWRAEPIEAQKNVD
jgi:hypothetical protein